MRRFNLRQISGLGKSLSTRQKITLGSVGSATAIASFALINVNASNPDTSKPASTSTTTIETHSTNDPVAPGDNNSTVNIQTEASTSASISGDGSENASVTVNGEPVTVPENGTINKTVITENGQTDVTVTRESQGSATNGYTNTTILNVTNSSTTRGGNN